MIVYKLAQVASSDELHDDDQEAIIPVKVFYILYNVPLEVGWVLEEGLLYQTRENESIHDERDRELGV